MQIEIVENKNRWDEFVLGCKPDTFLHSWNWADFNQKMGHTVWRFGIFDGEQCLAMVLILKIEARRGSFLFCPHGPIFAEGCNKKDVLDFLLAELKIIATKEKCAFIRISPLVTETKEHNELFLTVGFREAPIHMQHPELNWILDVRPTEEELLKNMRKTTRYCIKKAEKDGVEIMVSADSADLEKFWGVYEETFQRQNFTPFSKKFLATQFETFAQDQQILFFFAKYNEEIIATAIIVFYGNSAFYHHGASISKYAKLNAPYLLQWKVIQEAKKRGVENYNFWGIVEDDKPNHPWAGLSLFKKGFGGASHAYVHAKDFVISKKYWLSFVIETVRRKKRRL